MNHNKKVIIPIVIIFALVAYGVYYVLNTYAREQSQIVSGTIEATEIHIGTQMGGLITQIYVDEGDTVSEGQVLAEVQPASGASAGYTEKILTPIDGVVLTRAFEPGEIAVASSTLLVVGDLSTLDLTVYVPEDFYGQLYLGQTYPVSVDSFPESTFIGRITHIADEAEFTPRNVQTIEKRKNTVYAVRLTLDNPDLSLKPGMPADVQLVVEQGEPPERNDGSRNKQLTLRV